MSRLRELFEHVCDLSPAARAQALRDAGASEAESARVLSMLSTESATTARLNKPVATLVAGLADTELHPGDTLGVWRLLGEIGRGGMGAVFLAERIDGHFSQQAAIKLVRGLADAASAIRFADERQLLASLQHPQIARVFDGGNTPGGQPYLVMEYIEGIPLKQWRQNQQATLAMRLALMVSICRVVQFAHVQGVVHCDLKPGNILIRADGTPVLLDFGIAQVVNSDTAAVLSDAATHGPMTPLYASPEQRRGERLGPSTDIHALGLMVFEMVTGQPPPRERVDQPPVPSAMPAPVWWQRRLASDLDAIVARACAFDPQQRYASVAELAQDLLRMAHHQPVLARRATPSYVFLRLLRRRWPAFVLGSVLLMIGSAALWRVVQAERVAQREAQVAQRATQFLISAFALSDPSSSGRHDYSARDVLDRGAARLDDELADDPPLRARLLDALGNAYRGINEGDAGAPLLEEAARLALGAQVNDPRAAARSLQAKARTLLATRASTRDAEDAARRALIIAQRVAKDEPLLLADAWSTLANALSAAGHPPEEALEAAGTALALRQRHAAPVADLAASLLDLCAITSATGQQQRARSYCEQALTLCREGGLTRSDVYRQALRHHAGVLYYLGDYESSLEMTRDALAIGQALFGEHSAVLAQDRMAFAQALAERGLFTEADAMVERALPVVLARNGEHSSQYARALFGAGWVIALRGQYAAALPLLRHSVTLQERVAEGGDNNRLQVMRTGLAIVLIGNGEASEEARGLLGKV